MRQPGFQSILVATLILIGYLYLNYRAEETRWLESGGQAAAAQAGAAATPAASAGIKGEILKQEEWPPALRNPKQAPSWIIWLLNYILDAIKAYVKFALLLWGRLTPRQGTILADTFIGAAVLLFWLVVFSQFVLPVRGQSMRFRMQAVSRLLIYMIGGHGPALRVRDGKLVEREEESRRKGPGVILLDSASAAQLRRAASYTRTVGPGLVFTAAGEYIAGTIDLHRQNASLGPKDSDNPFAPQKEDEGDEEYAARQERRKETSGLTRDGIEVVPAMMAVSRIDPAQLAGERVTEHRFKYWEDSVRKAVKATAVNAHPDAGDEDRLIPWYKLPAYLAVDLWREYLRKFTLVELFAPIDEEKCADIHRGKTGLQVIQEMINSRLLKPQVIALDANGYPQTTSDPGGNSAYVYQDSREYDILRQRGIRVVFAPLRSVNLPETVDQKITEKWFSSWKQRAQDERDAIDEKRSYWVRQGKKEALYDFARGTIQKILPEAKDSRSQAAGAPPADPLVVGRGVLEQFTRGVLAVLIRDPKLHNRLTGEDRRLVEIIDWLRGRSA